MAAGFCCSGGPIVSEPVGAGGGHQEQLSGRGFDRLVGSLPVGDHAGGGQQSWVPGDGEGIQQAGRLVFTQFGGEVFEAVAGDQDDDVCEIHGRGLLGWLRATTCRFIESQ